MLLDVNALVALAWDSHVHHPEVRRWFADHAAEGWATCPVTEHGFVRVSSNAMILPAPVSVRDAVAVLAAFRAHAHHRFVPDDVSPTDADVPRILGHRQVTDAQLVTVARRAGRRLLTFDRGVAALGGDDVVLLPSLEPVRP